MGIAIYIAYSTMGTTVGHFTLLGTALCGFGVTYYVLRSKTWKRMQLHTQIDSTVEGVDESIREGDVGDAGTLGADGKSTGGGQCGRGGIPFRVYRRKPGSRRVESV